MFKIGCYLIVQAPFINFRNIWEDTDWSIIFLRKLWLFLCAGTMSACFSSLGNFEERIESLMSSHVYFAKKSTFFFSRLVLISSFCAAFFGSRLCKVFLTSLITIWQNFKSSQKNYSPLFWQGARKWNRDLVRLFGLVISLSTFCSPSSTRWSC